MEASPQPSLNKTSSAFHLCYHSIFTGGEFIAAQTAAEGKSEEAQSQLLMEKTSSLRRLKYYW
ncbi:hypothetical protein O9992_00465 [Vibrio lentus]|nr:hypothetical protein [Vibrio lentus]